MAKSSSIHRGKNTKNIQLEYVYIFFRERIMHNVKISKFAQKTNCIKNKDNENNQGIFNEFGDGYDADSKCSGTV